MIELNGGRPIFVEGEGDRIGRGPWARWFATAVAPDEGSPRAERGRVLARTGYVHSVTIARGEITALVIGSAGAEYRVGLAADTVPPRVWTAVVGSLRGRSMFEAAAAGREQSLQLEHVMTVDWDEPLIPRSGSIRRSCTCPDIDRTGACKHSMALGYVVANAIDKNPAVLLEWRGCMKEVEAVLAAVDPPTSDRWEAGPLPELDEPRALPVGSVLKRLGPSGLVIDGVDLRDALEPAYVAFASRLQR